MAIDTVLDAASRADGSFDEIPIMYAASLVYAQYSSRLIHAFFKPTRTP